MTPDDFLDAVAADSAHFASTTAGSLDVAIDHLGWTVYDLVAHLGAVYTAVMAATDGPSDVIDAPAGDAISDWFAERRTTLLATLSAADNETAAPTFAGPQTVGWWKRRIAHETAVHRWDAQAAIDGLDSVAPIDSALATDGVDEYLEVSLRHSSSRPDRVYPSESLHLHRSDGAGEWMLTGDGSDGLVITHEHGKGDAAVRGPASSLVLWLWGRPARDLEIFGDADVADRWQALAP